MLNLKEISVDATLEVIYIDDLPIFAIQCRYKDGVVHNPDAKEYADKSEYITFIFDNDVQIGRIIGSHDKYRDPILAYRKAIESLLLGVPRAGQLHSFFYECTLVYLNDNPVALIMDDNPTGILLGLSEPYYSTIEDALEELDGTDDDEF